MWEGDARSRSRSSPPSRAEHAPHFRRECREAKHGAYASPRQARAAPRARAASASDTARAPRSGARISAFSRAGPRGVRLSPNKPVPRAPILILLCRRVFAAERRPLVYLRSADQTAAPRFAAAPTSTPGPLDPRRGAGSAAERRRGPRVRRGGRRPRPAPLPGVGPPSPAAPAPSAVRDSDSGRARSPAPPRARAATSCSARLGREPASVGRDSRLTPPRRRQRTPKVEGCSSS